MKNNLKLAYLSLLLNLYYFAAWVYLFSSLGFEAGAKKFAYLFPTLLLSGIGTHIFLILITIYSITVFSKYKRPHRLMIVFQVAAGFLYLFQYL
jgi:hypothetical protein